MYEKNRAAALPLASLTFAALTLTASAIPTTVQAQTYPAKSVRIVSPYPPGGAVDVVGRPIAQKLSEAWGQPVIVDNRPGAGTVIGTELVVRAAPDGYTLLVTSAVVAINVSLYKLPFDPVTAFAPVALVAQAPLILAVHPSLPAKNAKEFISLAKSRPGQIGYGTSGNGTGTHLAMEMLKSAAKLDILHVPYKGATAMITALIGGEVQAVFNTSSSVMPHAKTGRLRALAISSPKRSDLAPELPTVAESALPGFEMIGWYAVFAPAGTPRNIVTQLNADINRVLQQSDLREKYFSAGMNTMGGTPEALGEYMKFEIGRWGKVVKEAGIKGE